MYCAIILRVNPERFAVIVVGGNDVVRQLRYVSSAVFRYTSLLIFAHTIQINNEKTLRFLLSLFV